MATELDVGGFSVTKTIEGQVTNVNVGTVRLKSTDELDVIATGDGGKTVLEFIQDAIGTLSSAIAPDDPVPPEWTELLRIPPSGIEIVISVGVRSEFKEPV